MNTNTYNQKNSILLPTINTIIFDFDGVLCKDTFYSSLKNSYPAIHNYVENNIFRGGGDLVNQWMRNIITSDDINRMISENNNIAFEEIKKIFEDDILNMKVDQKLLNFAKEQLGMGRKVALLTNNMDIFSTITVPNHKLNEIFDVIVNSVDYGLLKIDQGGRLFDIAMEKIGTDDYASTLLIDDSLKVKHVFEAKGGYVYTYNNFDDFIEWAKALHNHTQ